MAQSCPISSLHYLKISPAGYVLGGYNAKYPTRSVPCTTPSLILEKESDTNICIFTYTYNNTSETYIGLTETDFKTRHRNHTASFRHAKHKNSTELSKHIWTLKNDNIDYSISWRVLSSNSPYNSSSKRCNLCLKEKFLIIYRPDLSSLNKRNELVSSCRHRLLFQSYHVIHQPDQLNTLKH